MRLRFLTFYLDASADENDERESPSQDPPNMDPEYHPRILWSKIFGSQW